MIDVITIELINLTSDFNMTILPKENKCFVNNIEKEINQEKIDDLLSIIITWKNDYGSDGIDMERFTVKILSNGEVDKYSGEGIYPDNYFLFKEWISDFYG